MTMSRAIEFLEAHQSPTPSRWREDAQWRRDNEYWLKYARHITLQVLRAMDDQSITQVELAKRMGCTQQYVSYVWEYPIYVTVYHENRYGWYLMFLGRQQFPTTPFPR